MNDDDVEVGLVVPAAQGAGAEEDGAIDGGLGHQVPADGDGVWVGACVGDRGHLVAYAVSSHRWHGGTVQPGRGRALIRGVLVDVATSASQRNPGGVRCTIRPYYHGFYLLLMSLFLTRKGFQMVEAL